MSIPNASLAENQARAEKLIEQAQPCLDRKGLYDPERGCVRNRHWSEDAELPFGQPPVLQAPGMVSEEAVHRAAQLAVAIRHSIRGGVPGSISVNLEDAVALETVLREVVDARARLSLVAERLQDVVRLVPAIIGNCREQT